MIPDYQRLMLPLLKIASDGAEHRISDATEQLGEEDNSASKVGLVPLPRDTAAEGSTART